MLLLELSNPTPPPYRARIDHSIWVFCFLLLFFLPLREIESWNGKREKELPTFLPQLKRRLVPKGKHTCALDIFLELQKGVQISKVRIGRNHATKIRALFFACGKNRWIFTRTKIYTNYRYIRLCSFIVNTLIYLLFLIFCVFF